MRIELRRPAVPLTVVALLAAVAGVSCKTYGEDVCGDGLWGPLEECEPTYWDHIGYCGQSCYWGWCGDGDISIGEDCDPPDGVECDLDCTLASCGNGVRAPYELCFDERESLSTGDEPVDLHITDVDGDGDLDLLTANRGSGDVSLFLNQGGRFDPAMTLAVGSEPVALRTVDGGEDRLRLVVARSGDGGQLTVLVPNLMGYEVNNEVALEGAPSGLEMLSNSQAVVSMAGSGLVLTGIDEYAAPTSMTWVVGVVTDFVVADTDADGSPEIWAGATETDALLAGSTDQYLRIQPLEAPPIAVGARIPELDPPPDIWVLLEDGRTYRYSLLYSAFSEGPTLAGASTATNGNLDGVGFGPEPSVGFEDLLYVVGDRIGISWSHGPQSPTWDGEPYWLQVDESIGLIESTDLDGDGFDDIVVTHPDADGLTVLWSRP